MIKNLALLGIVLSLASCSFSSGGGGSTGGGGGTGGGGHTGSTYTGCYNDGYDDGFDDGYDDGYDGFDHECTTGYDDGYDLGYDDGFDDGDYDYHAGFSTRNAFDLTGSASRDLEKIGSMIEKRVESKIEDGLISKYGLSEERAGELSKAVLYFHKRSKTRKLSQRDLNLFTEQVSGMKFKTAKNYMKEALAGDKEAYGALIDQMSKFNKTSPESVQELVSDILVEGTAEEFLNKIYNEEAESVKVNN